MDFILCRQPPRAIGSSLATVGSTVPPVSGLHLNWSFAGESTFLQRVRNLKRCEKYGQAWPGLCKSFDKKCLSRLEEVKIDASFGRFSRYPRSPTRQQDYVQEGQVLLWHVRPT